MKNNNMNNRSGNSNKPAYTNTVPYSLKGKMVTVYRGGPESKKGKLVEVKPDYIALYAENSVIYYQSEHIKSISEDTKANAAPNILNQEIEYHDANDFSDLMNNFINKKVQVNQGGPEARNGVLLEVSNDVLVLNTEKDGIVYYNIHHVKSIKEFQNNDDNGNNTPLKVVPPRPEYIMGNDFNSLFNNMTHSWVSINRGGPEAVEGILVEDTDGFYTLINNQELFRIHPFHVRNISSGPKGSNDENNNNNENSQGENNNQSQSGEDTSFDSDQNDTRDRSTRRERRSGRRERRSGRSERRRSREHVVNTVNYVWKSRS